MASAPIFEKEILPQCSFHWHQKIINKSKNILDLCDDDAKIKQLFEECVNHIKNPESSKVTWNGEIQEFDGNEFPYIWFFNSKVLEVTIKMCVKIDVIERVVFIGKMDLPTKKEEQKLEKHLKKQVLEKEGGD